MSKMLSLAGQSRNHDLQELSCVYMKYLSPYIQLSHREFSGCHEHEDRHPCGLKRSRTFVFLDNTLKKFFCSECFIIEQFFKYDIWWIAKGGKVGVCPQSIDAAKRFVVA